MIVSEVHMRMRHFQLVSFALLTIAALTVSCGKGKKTIEVSNKPVPLSELTIEKMQLSKGLNFKLPDGIKNLGKSALGLSLSEESVGKKSREACETAGRMSDLASMLAGIGEEFCHLEAESANIEFGKKYKLNLLEQDDDDESFSLWVDNSEQDKLTLYQCYDNKLALKISIDSATEAGAKGSLNLAFNDSEDGVPTDFRYNINFDLSDSTLQQLQSQFTVKNSSVDYADSVSVTLADGGVSKFSSALKGAILDGNVALRGLIKHNGTQGQAMMKYALSSEETGDIKISTKSTFNAEGALADNSTAADEVRVAPTELPSFLPEGFTVEAPTGWDCQTEETIDIKMKTGPSAAAHAACSVSDENLNFDECDGDGYAVDEAELIED
jgi:hypothetical protein